jgi:hypothetical protein
VKSDLVIQILDQFEFIMFLFNLFSGSKREREVEELHEKKIPKLRENEVSAAETISSISQDVQSADFMHLMANDDEEIRIVPTLKLPRNLKEALKIHGIEWKHIKLEECPDRFYEVWFLQNLCADGVFNSTEFSVKRVRIEKLEKDGLLDPDCPVIAWGPKTLFYVDLETLVPGQFDFNFYIYCWSFDKERCERLSVTDFFDTLE